MHKTSRSQAVLNPNYLGNVISASVKATGSMNADRKENKSRGKRVFKEDARSSGLQFNPWCMSVTTKITEEPPNKMLENLLALTDSIKGSVGHTISESQDHSEATSHTPPNESLYVPILVNGFSVNYLLDSGSTLTVLHPETFSNIADENHPQVQGKPIKLCMGDGGVIQSCGESVMTITIVLRTIPLITRLLLQLLKALLCLGTIS